MLINKHFPLQNNAALREFLLVKLINGEKATFQTPTFSRKRERTLEMLIKDLYEEYVHDTKMVRIVGCMVGIMVCLSMHIFLQLKRKMKRKCRRFC